MCQYSARDGMPDDWHFTHLTSRAVGGAGIVFTEATAVEARGRISAWDLGLWNDEQRDAFARIVEFVEAQGAVAGIQLAHAGRKASVSRPWEGTKSLTPEQGAWETIGPSALPFTEGFHVPKAMDEGDIAAVLDAMAAATRRAREAGFRIVELHAAHGYLVHEFLSPISNRRDDEYGGDLEGRARFLMEMADAVRSEWPAELPLFVRLSCSDWIEGGFDLEQAVAVSGMLRARGDVDLVDCSSGGIDPRQRIATHPGYQVPFAEAIRRRAGIATGAVGLIHSPEMAEEILANGRADLIVLARALLANPYWPLRAAAILGHKSAWPVQYERGSIFGAG